MLQLTKDDIDNTFLAINMENRQEMLNLIHHPPPESLSYVAILQQFSEPPVLSPVQT